jgi:hypothetical protein
MALKELVDQSPSFGPEGCKVSVGLDADSRIAQPEECHDGLAITFHV